MKRALAERAKQSGLPNGVAAEAEAEAASSPAVVEKAITSSRTTTTPEQPPPFVSSSTTTTFGLSSSSSRGPPVVVGSSAETKTTTTLAPLNHPATTRTTMAPPPPTPSPRPKKRTRETKNLSLLLEEEEEKDDSNASAFYLRHQNRALASELRTRMYQCLRMEQERDYRRLQTSLALQGLQALQATWTQLETSLWLQNGCGTTTATATAPAPVTVVPSSSSSRKQEGGAPTAAAAAAAAAPVSTGSGTSVELIGALLDSLAALGAATKRRRRIRGDDDDDDDASSSSSSSSNEDLPSYAANDDTAKILEDAEQRQPLEDLLQFSDNVANRAATLQRWIWSLLQRVEQQPAAASNHNSTTSTTTTTVVVQQEPPAAVAAAATAVAAATATATHYLEQQVARLQSKNKTLKAQLKELARSRDEMSESDKRVRRGLYRLAAGRVQLKEVLKAIVTSDQDKEAAAAWMEAAPSAVVLSNAAAATAATNSNSNNSNSHPTAQVKTEGEKETTEHNSAVVVAQWKKQVADLEQVASARDEQIKKVREKRIPSVFFLLLLTQPMTFFVFCFCPPNNPSIHPSIHRSIHNTTQHHHHLTTAAVIRTGRTNETY